jgi:hypothetical protein
VGVIFPNPTLNVHPKLFNLVKEVGGVGLNFSD